MTNYKIIDADGHVHESIAELREFIEPRWQRRNLFPNDAWDRDLRGKLGAKPEGPEDQIAAMDQDGIDVMVLYPTAGLHVSSLHERDFATAVTRAYNDWLYHFCKTNPARLKFVALLAPQDPQAAAEEMMAMIATIIGGVFERFPKLNIAYLESGIGWVPYMMDRLDEEVEKRGAVEAPYLTKLPSEYVTGGRIFFGIECGEKTIPDAVRWGLDNTLLYSSDYPHWDGDWPHTVKAVRERGDLSASTKQKMLHDNVARFYKLSDAA